MHLVMFGVMIDTGPKFYTVPSPPPYITLRSRSQSQCMTLRSRSETLNFFLLNLHSVSCRKTFWLIWIVFGMNGYKILKCFRKENRVSGERPFPATGLIYLYPIHPSTFSNLLGWENESLFKWWWSHDQDGHHAHTWWKPLKIYFFGTDWLMLLKSGVQHWALEYYQFYLRWAIQDHWSSRFISL